VLLPLRRLRPCADQVDGAVSEFRRSSNELAAVGRVQKTQADVRPCTRESRVANELTSGKDVWAFDVEPGRSGTKSTAKPRTSEPSRLPLRAVMI
jgi:hypothetical protein